MTIDILCRVVDNFGDIGFVYRLARALTAERDAPSLRLVVDDLASFSRLCPEVDERASCQTVGLWRLVSWDNPGPQGRAEFRLQPPSHVIECYACGRPDWFEDLLFDTRRSDTAFVVNLEYFTCETWARDFHLLPSPTRSARVKKWMFMPGIEEGTGGLVHDAAFDALLDSCADAERRQGIRNLFLRECGACGIFFSVAESQVASRFWVTVFSYEHDFSSVIADLALFSRERPIAVFLAAGRSAPGFRSFWEKAGKPFPLVELPFLAQEDWDRLQCASDFCIVRGEESFARAILAGKPFLWECYPFSSGGQLPKVHAFLAVMERSLPRHAFGPYRDMTLLFNRAGSRIGVEDSGPEVLELPEGVLLEVLRSNLNDSFEKLARKTLKQGNLASKVLTLMRNMR